jgi:hypothetical protein
MNEFYGSKFNELFLEFNRYILVNPEFTEKFPQGAEVMLLDSRDAGYNNFMLKQAPKGEDVVFIDVGELAPVRSRLKHPKLVARPRIPA